MPTNEAPRLSYTGQFAYKMPGDKEWRHPPVGSTTLPLGAECYAIRGADGKAPIMYVRVPPRKEIAP